MVDPVCLRMLQYIVRKH